MEEKKNGQGAERVEAASYHPKAGSDLPAAHRKTWPRKPSCLDNGLTGFPDFCLEVGSESPGTVLGADTYRSGALMLG